MIIYLKCDDNIIAYNLALLNNTTLALWNCAFDSKYEECSPSKILLSKIVEYACDNNYKYVDFMRGNDSYKSRWANKLAQNYALENRKSLKSELVFLYRSNIPDFIKNKLRSECNEILQE
ncbi:MAG: hypothetical protein ACD_20C00429G0003 [uncultured bacterium]|nr:MAG: hypothetical protein ACD_20C00429G0003 [uncultured bacterium]HBH17951.1 hypothetical protein [Cyanobacteria bacterium UBA9579]